MTEPAPIDEALARRCEQEHPRLVGLLALHTGDPLLAEELAQDALVRLCEHWPDVRTHDEPAAWLTTVALNLARSRFRRRAARRRALARHGPEPVATRDDDATTIAVREAVAALPPRQREVTIRRFYLGTSVRETATAMGCAEGTVKSLTHRATTALRDAGLEPVEPKPGVPPRCPVQPTTVARRQPESRRCPPAWT